MIRNSNIRVHLCKVAEIGMSVTDRHASRILGPCRKWDITASSSWLTVRVGNKLIRLYMFWLDDDLRWLLRIFVSSGVAASNTGCPKLKFRYCHDLIKGIHKRDVSKAVRTWSLYLEFSLCYSRPLCAGSIVRSAIFGLYPHFPTNLSFFLFFFFFSSTLWF